ncbi:acyltransferase [Treponema sp.]|uniref:acyltransferase family protein n=1 Tax=Treponema sp. TaxID=166 RepID=UPI00298EB30D|nr:acyltransferase [Treponema sp.]MCR5613895.1 acyltransferase [Treponema sp.]
MNYISISVYVLLALSMAIGMKLAPRKKFNEDSMSLEAMTSLKGVMAIFVLCHHLSQKPLFQQTHTISVFEQIGFLFVGVFFLCSGYGLYKSFLTKENYLKTFLKRRVLPIVIFYYVMIAAYAVYHIVAGSQFTTVEWILKLSGLVAINTQSWYVPVIILMYVSFYFIFKNEKLRDSGILLLLLITFAQGILFCVINHFPWYAGESGWWKNPGAFANLPWYMRHCALPFEGEWWVNSTIGFVFGLTVAKYEKPLVEWSSKNFGFKFFMAIFVFAMITIASFFCMWEVGYWTEFGGNLGTANKFVCYIVQCMHVVAADILVLFIMRKACVHNKFYNFIGKRSLEVYLMQEIALFSFEYLIQNGRTPIFKPNNWNIALYITVVTATVLVSAIIYHWINVLLTKKLKNS